MKGTPMIPKEIDDVHIKKAAKDIDINGVPRQRESRKYLVQIGDTLYPPKYVISIATKHLRGKELNPSDFIAAEAKVFLEKRGYRIAIK